jgi:hypothetical protein
MTIQRAREILKGRCQDWSDEKVKDQLNSLQTIARIAAKAAIKEFHIYESPSLSKSFQ